MTPVLRPGPRPRFRRGPVSGGTTQGSIGRSGFLTGSGEARTTEWSGCIGLSHAQRPNTSTERRAATVQAASHGPEREAFLAQATERRDIDRDHGTTESLAARLGSLEAGG